MEGSGESFSDQNLSSSSSAIHIVVQISQFQFLLLNHYVYFN